MKQMMAPQVAVLKKVQARLIEKGFVRDRSGKIFYIWRMGDCAARHIVLEDGKVVRKTDDFPSPYDEVMLIDQQACGITQLVFADSEVTVQT